MFEDWQENNLEYRRTRHNNRELQIQIGYMTWQPSLIFQVENSYFISLAGYGMKIVIMGVGAFICPIQQERQGKNVAWIVF
jgi:hypothetical protein